jgi:hypothetical protein
VICVFDDNVLLEDAELKVTRGTVFDLVERFARKQLAEDSSRMQLAVGISKEFITARYRPTLITT